MPQFEIWRRIEVRDSPLTLLHRYIQEAMGWESSHLYQFEIEGLFYADLDLVDETCADEAGGVMLGDLVPRNGERFRFGYEYDFGDSWKHEILFEGCTEAREGVKYPRCTEGERACPPEDVGGLHGFEGYLEAMADPKHEEHEACLEWRGPYDPDAFSAEETTERMQKRRHYEGGLGH